MLGASSGLPGPGCAGVKNFGEGTSTSVACSCGSMKKRQSRQEFLGQFLAMVKFLEASFHRFQNLPLGQF